MGIFGGTEIIYNRSNIDYARMLESDHILRAAIQLIEAAGAKDCAYTTEQRQMMIDKAIGIIGVEAHKAMNDARFIVDKNGGDDQ